MNWRASTPADPEGRPFAPSSLLNRMRREAVEKLQEAQAESHPEVHPVSHQPAPRAATARAPAPELHLLVRTPAQLEAALSIRPAGVTLDYLDLYGLKPSVERVRSAGIQPRVASPRVLKPGEERIVDFLLSCDCSILVRSAGLLHALHDHSPHALRAGDFSLNAANAASAAEFFALGLASLTPTHDLNADQIADLARAAGGERMEAILYQHLPVFHTEHCVFCRFLSNGTKATRTAAARASTM